MYIDILIRDGTDMNLNVFFCCVFMCDASLIENLQIKSLQVILAIVFIEKSRHLPFEIAVAADTYLMLYVACHFFEM